MTVKHPDDIVEALEVLARVGKAQMLRRGIVPLYASGVRYKRESPKEIWKPFLSTLRDGHGDCEDLVGWRVAELRLSGNPAYPAMYRTRNGYHAVVYRPDKGVEDPSEILGM